jgi:hypothetical protein
VRLLALVGFFLVLFAGLIEERKHAAGGQNPAQGWGGGHLTSLVSLLINNIWKKEKKATKVQTCAGNSHLICGGESWANGIP